MLISTQSFKQNFPDKIYNGIYFLYSPITFTFDIFSFAFDTSGVLESLDVCVVPVTVDDPEVTK